MKFYVEREFIIYRIENTRNAKLYFGQTVETAASRWSKHLYCARVGKGGCKKLMRAMRKYGLDSFRMVVIARTNSAEVADYYEAQLIKRYRTQDDRYGYNITPGGAAEVARFASKLAHAKIAGDPVLAARRSQWAKNIVRYRDPEAHRQRLIERNKSVPPHLRREYARRSHAALTPEQRSERTRLHWQNMDPEKKAAQLARMRSFRGV